MRSILYTSSYSSPLGNIILSASSTGLVLLEFDDGERLEKQYTRLSKFGDFKLSEDSNEILEATKQQLEEYFASARKEFTLPIDSIGTDFQLKVWDELVKVPYGSTRTYKEQAIAVGDLKAIRAVAKANGENRIAIIIPCHRIIGSNDSLVGYAGGLWRKKKLLELESDQGSLF